MRIRIRLSASIALILLCSASALATNLSLDVAQYAHTTWTLRNSAFKGYPRSLVQTADGYLWLATEQGVLRFDGVRFMPWRSPDTLPKGFVVKLLAGRDGSLWTGLDTGLARLKDGRLRLYPALANQYVSSLLEDRGGVIWVGTSAGLGGSGTLCAIRGEDVECYGQDGRFGRFVLSLFEDNQRNLWVGAGTGLWKWHAATPTLHSVAYPLEIHSVTESADGTVLAAMNREIQQLKAGVLEPYRLGAMRDLKPTVLLRDRLGALWIGTQDQGLLHVHHGRVDSYGRTDGLSGDFVTDILEDREGNVWVATLGGLDRFRHFTVATITRRQGLSSDSVVSALASRDGSLWLGTLNGLNRWRDGQVRVYGSADGLHSNTVGSLYEDGQGRVWVSSPSGLAYLQDNRVNRVETVQSKYVHAMMGDRAGNLWISDQDRGLYSVRDGRVSHITPWSVFENRIARTLALDPSRGGLWLGFFQGGLVYFENDTIHASYSVADGLGRGEVTSLQFGHDGALWVATRGGLSRVKDGRAATLTSRNGLPCDSVHWVIEDAVNSLWLYSACGLVHIARSEIEAWTRDGNRTIEVAVHDDTDGVRTLTEAGSYGPKVTRTPDGQLWFTTYDGASVIVPGQLPFNSIVPPVHIEQVTADRVAHDPAHNLRLPPAVRDLRIDFTALSLIAPEEVRFRYKLEGRDLDWVDAGNRREAFYTDLGPDAYRFRVIASNNDSVWNEEGAILDFSIAPAFYQTTVFRVAVGLVGIALLWTAYWLRLRSVAAQMNVRFEERLSERTRIAQELHDTLLQGFVSTSMQLHVLEGEAAGHPIASKLARILQHVVQVIEEGRRTVHGLRSGSDDDDRLERALTRDLEDFGHNRQIEARVIVEGKPRPLHPIARNEAYRISREAIANAFRHAQPTRVEVAVEYGARDLRVIVRDDGGGIEPELVQTGRLGHWGIPGMRERADKIAATLTIRSRVKAGTEVELLVPGQVAYQALESKRSQK
ncbi:MAG TPA: two-component regulator propeller domain-containing protein [Vicinamibacterales bacterium]|nr:two-component regulator propeller domain-containing protein [Vicinamibacterales bacterium]